MDKDLTNSGIERQNILNNELNIAIERIQEYLGLQGMLFDGEKYYQIFIELLPPMLKRWLLSTHQSYLNKNKLEYYLDV